MKSANLIFKNYKIKVLYFESENGLNISDVFNELGESIISRLESQTVKKIKAAINKLNPPTSK